MAARSHERTSLTIQDFVDAEAQVVALDSFRPPGSAMIERGRFYPMDSPAVLRWPEYFALVVRIDRILDEIIERYPGGEQLNASQG